MEKKAIRVAYGEAIVKLGAENDKVVVFDADLAAATMTNGFKKAYPDRFIDCGIAEANMVDMAAGASTMGLIPFCSTFAVFAGRSYDQIRNGVCYPKLNVKLGFSHAGITLGEDGGSHQAIEDIALMRVLPGMTILCPCDAEEACNAIWNTNAPEGITEEQRVACLDTLLKHRPKLLQDANFCEYAMERAINFPCAGTLEYLLKKGVPATLVTNGGTGWTLLDYAISVDFKEGEALLRQYGATEHPNVDSCVYPDFEALMKNM